MMPLFLLRKGRKGGYKRDWPLKDSDACHDTILEGYQLRLLFNAAIDLNVAGFSCARLNIN